VTVELRAPGAPVLRVGSVLELGTFSLTEAEIKAFATTWDPMPIHTDDAAAAAGPFGQIVASGLHTFLTVGRAVTTEFNAVYPIIAGRGFRHLRLRNPVAAGTRFSATLTIDELKRHDAERLFVVLSVHADDEHGREVLDFQGELLARG
jgi:acyl dehydratase